MQELLLSVWDRLKPTIIFVTHDIDEAIFLADKIYIMSARPGRIETVLDTHFARPRAIELTATQAFNELKLSILKTIRQH
jgi:NitT/TauT family transport system ATP-binding protein